MTRLTRYRHLLLTGLVFALALRAQTKDVGHQEPSPTGAASAPTVAVDAAITTQSGTAPPTQAPTPPPSDPRPAEQTGTGAAATKLALKPRTPAEVERAQQAQRHMSLPVVATDMAGLPVSGLHAADFTLLDNGKAQTITSVHSLQGRATVPPTEVILVLDAVNAAFQPLGLARQGIDKYLRRDGGHLPLPTSVVFFSDSGAQIEAASRDGYVLADNLSRLKLPIRVFDAAQGFRGALERVQSSTRMLTRLLAYEATRPGRKLLVWVGPGWPLLNGSSASFNTEQKNRYFATIVDLTTALRKAQVTLYSVVPLDLSEGVGLRPFLYQDYLKGVDSPKHADAPNIALQVFAIQSGGLVLEKSGDVAGQISRCVADASSYYEIVFDALPALQPDEYHRLEVQVARSGALARTRTGYYAEP